MQEQERRLLQEKLQDAEKIAKIGSWSFDVATGKIFWSRQMFEIFQEDPEKYESLNELKREFPHIEFHELRVLRDYFNKS